MEEIRWDLSPEDAARIELAGITVRKDGDGNFILATEGQIERIRTLVRSSSGATAPLEERVRPPGREVSPETLAEEPAYRRPASTRQVVSEDEPVDPGRRDWIKWAILGGALALGGGAVAAFSRVAPPSGQGGSGGVSGSGLSAYSPSAAFIGQSVTQYREDEGSDASIKVEGLWVSIDAQTMPTKAEFREMGGRLLATKTLSLARVVDSKLRTFTTERFIPPKDSKGDYSPLLVRVFGGSDVFFETTTRHYPGIEKYGGDPVGHGLSGILDLYNLVSRGVPSDNGVYMFVDRSVQSSPDYPLPTSRFELRTLSGGFVNSDVVRSDQSRAGFGDYLGKLDPSQVYRLTVTIGDGSKGRVMVVFKPAMLVTNTLNE